MEINRRLSDSTQEHLHYLLWECPSQEYDPEQVAILIALKRKLNGGTVTKFPVHIAYHSQRNQQQIIHISHTPPARKNIAAALGIAVAACIVSFILISNNAPVQALPDTGFFLFLRQDKDGIFAITSPSHTDTENTPALCTDCACCKQCDCGCNDEDLED